MALILAPDPDREGEAICFHVAIVLGLNPCHVKRIKFQEITKKAIQNAVANPGLIDMSLVKIITVHFFSYLPALSRLGVSWLSSDKYFFYPRNLPVTFSPLFTVCEIQYPCCR